MFNLALTFRNEQYGEDSNQLEETYENVGRIYLELNDFVTAAIYFDKALKIRGVDQSSK